jgi:hypothetical protein
MTDAQTATARKRSPSYPAINLEQAIARAREIWDKQHDYATPLSAIFTIWGYKSAAGNANLVIAALRKFGLVDYEGSGNARKVKLTALAIQILDHPDDTTRMKATQEAALLPTIHRELWEKFGAKLPTDDHLRWELEQERGFSRSGSAEFIPEYRHTIAFARLTTGDTVTPQTPQDHSEEDSDEQNQTPDPQKPPRLRRMSEDAANVLTIPLMGGSPVMVEGAFPITEQDWDQMMAVLNAMKPGLVSHAEPDEDD